MYQTEMTNAETIRVLSCDIVENSIKLEEYEYNNTIWGLRVEFSDGRVDYIPDLCTQISDANTLKNRLEGAELSSDFLPDVVDDFLGEVYGLRL